jgi:hypothetical protein
MAMSTRTVKLTESRPIGDGFKLDKEAGIAYGVAVCGGVSLNGRDYPDDVRDRDKAVYEGVDCFIDHADGNSNRRVREWFGKIKNPRTRLGDRKTIGDLHYPTKSNFTEEFIERCERFPNSFALSHVASCKSKRVNGRDKIESISKVHSVDLVIGAATNNGICESITNPGQPMKLSEYIASGLVKFAGSKGFLALKEAYGDSGADMAGSPPAMADAKDDADPVKAACSSAMHSLVDAFDAGEIDLATLQSKVKDLGKLHGKDDAKEEEPKEKPKAKSDGDGKDSEDAADKKKDAKDKKEQAEKIDRLTVENMALRAGVTLTDLQTKAVLGLTDDAERKTLVESFKPGKGGKPESGERPPLTEQEKKHTGALPPTDGKKFLESLSRH